MAMSLLIKKHVVLLVPIRSTQPGDECWRERIISYYHFLVGREWVSTRQPPERSLRHNFRGKWGSFCLQRYRFGHMPRSWRYSREDNNAEEGEEEWGGGEEAESARFEALLCLPSFSNFLSGTSASTSTDASFLAHWP